MASAMTGQFTIQDLTMSSPTECQNNGLGPYEQRYWMCVIGPTEQDLLPSGADAPLRNAVVEAFEKLTGHEDDNCWSGWGTTKEEVEYLLRYDWVKAASFWRRLKFLITGNLSGLVRL